MGHNTWRHSVMTIKFSSSHDIHDVYNLTDRCAIQPRAGCNWQFSLQCQMGSLEMESTIENQGEMKEKSDGRLVHPWQKKGTVFCCSWCTFSSSHKWLIWDRFHHCLWDSILQTIRGKHRNFGWAYAKSLLQKLCRLLCCCFLVMFTWNTGTTLTLSRTHWRLKFLCHTRSYLLRRS